MPGDCSRWRPPLPEPHQFCAWLSSRTVFRHSRGTHETIPRWRHISGHDKRRSRGGAPSLSSCCHTSDNLSSAACVACASALRARKQLHMRAAPTLYKVQNIHDRIRVRLTALFTILQLVKEPAQRFTNLLFGLPAPDKIFDHQSKRFHWISCPQCLFETTLIFHNYPFSTAPSGANQLPATSCVRQGVLIFLERHCPIWLNKSVICRLVRICAPHQISTQIRIANHPYWVLASPAKTFGPAVVGQPHWIVGCHRQAAAAGLNHFRISKCRNISAGSHPERAGRGARFRQTIRRDFHAPIQFYHAALTPSAPDTQTPSPHESSHSDHPPAPRDY